MLQYATGLAHWYPADITGTVYPKFVCGFQPVAMRFSYVSAYSNVDTWGANHIRRGMGFCLADGLSQVGFHTYDRHNEGTSICGSLNANDCVIQTMIGTPARTGRFVVSAVDGTGFFMRVDEQQTSQNTGISFLWEAWGGTGVEANFVLINEPAATGVVAYTLGFQPDALLFMGINSTVATNSVTRGASGFTAGFATAVANQAALCGTAADGAATASVSGMTSAGAVLLMSNPASASAVAALSAISSTGFSLNWTTRTTTNRRYCALGLKGGSWLAGAYGIAGQTNGSSQRLTPGFVPAGISMLARGIAPTGLVNPTVGDRIGFGAGNAVNNRGSMGNLSVSGGTNSACYLSIEFDSVISYPGSTSLDGRFDLSAMTSTYIDVTSTGTGGVAAEQHIYLIFGNPPSSEGTAANLTTTAARLAATARWYSDAAGSAALTTQPATLTAAAEMTSLATAASVALQTSKPTLTAAAKFTIHPTGTAALQTSKPTLAGVATFTAQPGVAVFTVAKPTLVAVASAPVRKVGPDPATGLDSVGWSGENEVNISNDVYCYYTMPAFDTTTPLVLIPNRIDTLPPGNYLIRGIEIEVQAHGTRPGVVRDTTVQLTKNGATPVGSNRGTGTPRPLTDTTTYYGGPADLWGAPWYTGDIQDAGFGVVLTFNNSGAVPAVINIDYVSFTIYYEVATSAILPAAGRSGTTSRTDRPGGQTAQAIGRSRTAARVSVRNIPSVILYGMSRGASRDTSVSLALAGALPARGNAVTVASSRALPSVFTGIVGYGNSISPSLDVLGLPAITAQIAGGVDYATSRASARPAVAIALAGRDVAAGATRTPARVLTQAGGRSVSNSGADFGVKGSTIAAFATTRTARSLRAPGGARIQTAGRDAAPTRGGARTGAAALAFGRIQTPAPLGAKVAAIAAARAAAAVATSSWLASRAIVQIAAADRMAAYTASQGAGIALAEANSVAGGWSTVLASSPTVQAHGRAGVAGRQLAPSGTSAVIVGAAQAASRARISAAQSFAQPTIADVTVRWDKFSVIATTQLRGRSFTVTVTATPRPLLSVGAIATITITQAALARIIVY